MSASDWVPACAGMTVLAATVAVAQPIYDDPKLPPDRDAAK
jgi:hypothetical protein